MVSVVLLPSLIWINRSGLQDRGIGHCSPELPFSAQQLDTPRSSLSKGYNMRKALPGDTSDTRTLVKEYGFRFRIEVLQLTDAT